MNARHLEAFVAPAVHVLAKMARTEVRAGEVSARAPSLGGESVSVVIGLNGGISGTFVLTAARREAWALAGLILGGPPEDEARDEVLDVLSELANVIAGNATGRLYELGVSEGITPPTVVTGPAVGLDFTRGAETVHVPLETRAGTLEMVLSIFEENA
ncbi:MAG: hypothetical protein HGA98_05005 [Deltaproteobacteria bacterium]|nr:hypothetical protein [Deltaproteobacteria bacterium]